MSNCKLLPVEPTTEMIDLIKRLRIKASMIELGELIAWGSDSALMREAAVVLEEVAAPAVQGEPVAYAVFASNGNIRIWCADPVQAETLRQQYGEALQPLYTAPQPAEQQPSPDVARLVEALEGIVSDYEFCKANGDTWGDRGGAYVETARTALSTYREQGGEK